jgi:lysophospholipase
MPDNTLVAMRVPSAARAADIPPLAPRFLEPPGFAWGHVAVPGGALLRWGHLAAAQPRAECVMALGFTEFIEKYFETMRDLAARGLSVWCLEWRGQGGSGRPRFLASRPRARHFERDAADLACFAGTVLSGRHPHVLIAHSMGAAIALVCLHRHPRLFDAAILSAPMLGIRTPVLPPGVTRRIAAVIRAAGLGVCFVPGRGQWRFDLMPSPESSRLSSDPERCRIGYSWFAARPALRVDGPTYGWLATALRLVALIGREEFLAGIATPILLGTPGIEHFVRPQASRRAARLLPDCTLVDLPDSRHEPFLERDEIRDRWLAAIDAFLAERLPPAR